MEKEDIIRRFDTPTLAYIGDAVFELYVREYLLDTGAPVNELHCRAKRFVSAAAQSGFAALLEPVLSEEEAGVYRRGRNAKPHSHPKNVDLSEYHRATGLEALFGFLHLAGDTGRMRELFRMITEQENEE